MCLDYFRRPAILFLTLVWCGFAYHQVALGQPPSNPMNQMNVPSEILLKIEMADYRKYKLNVAKGFYDQQSFIPTKYKRTLKSRIRITRPDGGVMWGAADVRITGDMTDHIRIKDVVSSLHVKLLDDHLSGITTFKLLLPGTRFGYHEIFVTTLLEELNFVAPYTRMVDVNLNGYQTKMLFQEVPAKELLERFSLREAPIIEGDERQYYQNIMHGGGRHICCTGRLDNSKWLTKGSRSRELIVGNALTRFTGIVVRGDEDEMNHNHHKFALEDTSLNEMALFLTATHGQSAHNRKLYYDPMYDRFRPIYYDGDAELLGKHTLRPERLGDDVRSIILENGFVDRVINEYSRRAGPLDEETLVSLELLEGRTYARLPALRTLLKELVNAVNAYEIDKTAETKNAGSLQIIRDLRPPAPIELFNALSPYLFVTRDPGSGQGLLCAVHPGVTSESLLKFSFDLSKEVDCNRIDEETFHRAFKGNRSVKSADPPHRVFIHTPGTIPIEGITSLPNTNVSAIRSLMGAKASQLNGFNHDYIHKAKTRLFPVRRYDTRDKRYNFADLKEPHVVEVEPGSTHFIYFNSNENKNTRASLELRLFRTGHDIGRVVLIGDTRRLERLKVIGIDTAIHLKPADTPEPFDDRLLTGCVTFLDAKVASLSIAATNLHCEDMINFVRTRGEIRELRLKDGGFDALDVDFSQLDFGDVFIERAGNDCADFSAGYYKINNFYAGSCEDKGISVGEMSNLRVKIARIENATIGIASKDSSEAVVRKANMSKVDTCFSAYRKKQEFDGGTITYNQFNGDCTRFIDIDELSSVVKHD